MTRRLGTLLLLLPALCSSAPTSGMSVTAYAASPTQTVLSWLAPDTKACKVEVSESATFSPLVHDVDASLFSGSNMDSRTGSLTSGTQRVFVVGTRVIQTAANNRKYSRALQQNTQHYYRITCSSTIATGTFTTKILPFGATSQDLPPTNADGTYNYPSTSDTDRNETIVDSQTGVLLRRVNLPSDNASRSTPWPTAAGFGESCSRKLDAQGFYHCLFNDNNGGVFPNLYAIHPVTGEVRFLGAAYFYRTEIDPQGSSLVGVAGGGETVMWDPADANVAYVGVLILATGRSTIVKWTYTGVDNPGTNIAGTPAQSPHHVVDLLGGRDLATLATAFDPRFDRTKFSCTPVSLQGTAFMLKCARGYQNTIAWEGVFDMKNGQPLGSGGNGGIVAMAPGWALPGSRWCGDHSSEFIGNSPVLSFAVNSLSGLGSAPYDGGGPYSVTVTAPVPAATAGSLTPMAVGSLWDSSWGAAPAQWQPGEPVSPHPDHFLLTANPGDIFSLDNEVVKLVTKTSSSSWIVQRGLSDTAAVAHNAGISAYTKCESAKSALTYSGGYIWWDFVNSPSGTNPADWVMNFGNHPVSRGRYRVDSGYPIRTGVVTDKSTWGKFGDMTVTSHPVFAGHSAPGDGNSYQKHASMASGDDLTFFDSTYFVGTSLFSAQNASATTKVSGSLYQYNYSTGVSYGSGTFLTPKYFPTLAKTAGRLLVDASGPGAKLTGTTADSYKYCIANAAGECSTRADGTKSQKGDIFFNHPALDPTYPWCTGGENPVGTNDICMGNFASMGVAAMQFKIENDAVGQSYRALSRTFQNFDATQGSNLKLTYGGEWAIFFSIDPATATGTTTHVFAMKVPPIPASDGIDRSTFVPAQLSIATPQQAGIVSARVRFGYAEQGPISSYYCTSRRESCVATAATIDPANPFSYRTTDTFKAAPCAVACIITIPVYPLHTAYYIVEFLNASGAVVTSTTGVALEKTIVPLIPGVSGATTVQFEQN